MERHDRAAPPLRLLCRSTHCRCAERDRAPDRAPARWAQPISNGLTATMHQHRTGKEEPMDANLVAHAETLRQTAERLARVGLIFDRACITPEQRRIIFALQRVVSESAPQPEPKRALIGFGYPNAR